jgi:hypothetical protein
MPIELVPPFLVLFFIALGAGGIELRNSLRAPVCPRCVHCRHEALARQRDREAREANMTRSSAWGADDRDDDRRRPGGRT